MKKIALVVHGGAGEDSEFIRSHQSEYKQGLEDALNQGYHILQRGGTAIEAVKASIMSLEDNPLFNCAKGSALNEKGEVEMDASIMDGATLQSGAVAIVKNIKNPISLAHKIMYQSNYRLLGGLGATEYAKSVDEVFEEDDYFITEQQSKELEEKQHKGKSLKEQKFHGTVGAVALDDQGDLAAGTSTGGTVNCREGRIGDSCMIGIGCYANNRRCAVSGTGDGEFLMKGVIANTIACYMEYKSVAVQEACNYVVLKENSGSEGDIGVISLDPEGNIGIAFNSERMHRGYKTSDISLVTEIYK